MVLVAIAGGTGTAGRAVAAEALRRGLAVRSISRRGGSAAADAGHGGAAAGAAVQEVRADFRTGEGVPAALAGVDVLIETLDARGGAALKALPVTSQALLDAAEAAGVRHAVLLSIVNAAECSLGYYQVQAARARSYDAAPLPSTVVYATQFHDLVAGIFAAGARLGVIPAFRGVSFQPIAPTDVARVLVDEALRGLGTTAQEPRSVIAGGPRVAAMRDLAAQWQRQTQRRGLVVSVGLPGDFGTFLRAGRNLVPEFAVGTVDFAAWLAAHRPR